LLHRARCSCSCSSSSSGDNSSRHSSRTPPII
jgi:hypothetical protein